MTQKIITITREYGSGGRLIAKKVAEALNIAFYDNELIDETEKTFGEVGSTVDNLMSGIHIAEQSINKILESTSIIADNISHLSATGEEIAAASAEGIKVSDSTVESMKECKVILNNIYELANELKVSVEE